MSVTEVELAQTAACPEASRAHRDLARLYCVQRDTEYAPDARTTRTAP